MRTFFIASLFKCFVMLLVTPCTPVEAVGVKEDVSTEIPTHEVRNEELQPLGDLFIQQLQWKSNRTILDPFAAHIKVSPKLKETMRQFCDDMGITDVFRNIFSDAANELQPGEGQYLTLGKEDDQKYQFYLQRPASSWKSNMHWLNANDEQTHDWYMEHLMEGGFREVLNALGRFYGLDGIDCYSIGFIGVSHCEQGFIHTDFKNVDGKAFNVLVPIYLVEGSDPEFIVNTGRDDDLDIPGTEVKVHYEYDMALAVGDFAYHGTAEIDYRDQPGKFRMAMSIYLGDIRKTNVERIIQDYTDPFPPTNPEYLLQHWGRHWKKSANEMDSDKNIGTALSISRTEVNSADSNNIHKSQVSTPDKMFMKKAHRQRKDDRTNEDGDDEEKLVDVKDLYLYIRPFDPLNFNRNEFIDHFDCEEVFNAERPIPTTETWDLLRSTLEEIAKDDEHSYAPPSNSGQGDGFFVPVEVRQAPGRGRGVYATDFIPRDTWVWTAKHKGWLAGSALYRKFLLAIPTQLACDTLGWVYIHELDEDPYKISLELDIGTLVNAGNDDTPTNLVCLEDHEDLAPGGCKDNFFADRDIYPGEELLIDYDFVNKEAWSEIGLENNHWRM